MTSSVEKVDDSAIGVEAEYGDTPGGTSQWDISEEHRNYLIAQHGTADLNPLPSMDSSDPLNWPKWKKNMNLIVVASLAFMTTFMAAGISPAFHLMAKDLHVTVRAATYLTSSQICMHGIAPLVWKPIANHYGRRPIWIISALGSLAFNIGSATGRTYAAQQICRCLTTFFISTANGIGSAVVTETYFLNKRAEKMGYWTLGITLGPFAGPFLMGFVVNRTGSWRWIFWIFAIANGVQLLLILVFCPETRYVGKGTIQRSRSEKFRRMYLHVGRVGEESLSLSEFLVPMRLFTFVNVLIPTIACSVVFNYASVLFTVEVPPLFAEKFGFNPEQTGLQFVSLIVGSFLGEIAGGPLSDFWMSIRAQSLGRRPPPEYRIWLSYIGFTVAMVGLLIWGVQMQNIGKIYNVTPMVGAGMAGFGNQLITTTLVTYIVDVNEQHAASIGVFFNLVRSTWGWLGPFWFPSMLASLNFASIGGLMVGTIAGACVLPVAILQWKGEAVRTAKLKKEELWRTATSRV